MGSTVPKTISPYDIVRRVIDTATGTTRMPITASDNDTTTIVDPLLYENMRLIRRSTTTEKERGSGVQRRGVKRKKPGRISRPVQVKYGVTVPRNVKHAYELDAEEGHSHWTLDHGNPEGNKLPP